MMLEVSHLKVSYDRVLALSDVSIQVPRGKIVALVGGNGNGKSTTLRAIAGLNDAEAGQIVFDGQPIHRKAAHQRVRDEFLNSRHLVQYAQLCTELI